MNDISTLLSTLWPPPIALGGDDRRRFARAPVELHGRLAFGGTAVGLVGCALLDLSATGARVETFALLDSLPDILTLEFAGMYNRVRRRWTDGRQIGLEFVTETRSDSKAA